MKNILIVSNCVELTEKISTILKDYASVCTFKFTKETNLPVSIYTVYDCVFLHVSKKSYSFVEKLIKKSDKIQQFDYILLTDDLKKNYIQNLIKYSPLLVLDFAKKENLTVYNLQSVVKNYNKLRKENTLISDTFNFVSYQLKNQNHHSKAVKTEDATSETEEKVINFTPSTIHLKTSYTLTQLYKLSKRELECFYHLLNNKKIKEICKIMNIKGSTVGTLKTRIFKKLNINSTVGLIHFAYQHKLIK